MNKLTLTKLLPMKKPGVFYLEVTFLVLSILAAKLRAHAAGIFLIFVHLFAPNVDIDS